jgi:hypothetical protein
MEYAVIENGVVTNTVIWDGITDWAPPEGSSLEPIPDGTMAGIGWTYLAGTFTAPPPQAPPAA